MHTIHLYHASKTTGLAELFPRVSSHQTKYVYAIENPVTALLFGAPKDDFDFLLDEEDGIPCVYECYHNAFENIYKNQNCSLYEVDSAFFQKGKTGWKPEWISEQPVIVLNETKIDNLYEELQKAQSQNQLIIHKFLEQNSYKNMIAQHIIDRLIRFDLLEKAEQDPRFQKQFRKLFEQLKILLSGEYL